MDRAIDYNEFDWPLADRSLIGGRRKRGEPSAALFQPIANAYLAYLTISMAIIFDNMAIILYARAVVF